MKKHFILAVTLASSLAAAEKPNFLLLLSDDQAWNGLSCAMHPEIPDSGSDVIETPNIARLAAEGMRFSAGYSPASVCSPTRISLQTGKSPAACHWTKAAPSMTAADGFKLVPPVSRRNIAPEETTIAELLKTAGYATAHFGKWHLGGGGPESHGYDVSDGDTGNQDAAPHLEPNPVDIFGMGERAAAFMERNAKSDTPFFIQMSYHALHYPQNATKALVEKYAARMPRGNDKEIGRAAISEDLDRGIGLLLGKVESLGLRENTYVVYLSDNGSSTRGALRGGKGGVWEGGIRVPLIVRGPGISANSWCHERVVGYDLYPTFCHLAGVTIPLPTTTEGGLITHLLQGGTGAVQRPRSELVFHFPHYQGDTPHTALLLGQYKLMRFYEDGDLHLFDLESDIRESRNLADSMPEKAAEMVALMDRYLTEVEAAMPTPNAQYDPNRSPAARKGGGERKVEGGGKKGKGGGVESETRGTPVESPAAEKSADPIADATTEEMRAGPGGGGGKPPRNPIFEILDTDRDKELSAAELSEATTKLSSLDRNENGQLDADEFRADAEMPAPPNGEAPGGRTPWILVHALEIDANGDGVVELQDELMAEAARVFVSFDSDSDRSISQEEAETTDGLPKSPLAGFVRQHAAELDRDRDGEISRQEMADQFRKFFNEIDGNGDGLLSPEEHRIEGEGKPPSPAKSGPLVPSVTVAREGAPNIVLILIDDMGWNAMGFTGNNEIDTPRTDAMAREGLIFTNAYASAPNCAPTRACLMSGQYPPRHGVYTVVDDRHSPGSPHHRIISAESNSELATESVTIAEALRSGGYTTGMFGMWNLGRGKDGPTTPTGQGFDIFKQPRDFGFDKDRYRNEAGDYLTDELTTGGIEWMREHSGEPFFLYLAYHGIHSPYEPKPELLEKYRDAGVSHPDYAATVDAVDQNVGRIVDALAELSLIDDTVIILHSDNGGERRLMAPLREGKGTLYEGGIRAPTLIWGAGIATGECAEPVLSMDLYPTMLELAGLSPPPGHRIDGASLVSILNGSARTLGRDRVFWHFPSYIGGGGPSSAMRKGDWKVIEQFESRTIELYNLAEDPGETRNLFDSEGRMATELVADLRAWQEEMQAPRPHRENPDYDPQAPAKSGRDARGKK